LEKNDEQATNTKLEVYFGASPHASDAELQHIQDALRTLTEKIFEADTPTVEVKLVNSNQDILVTVEFASGKHTPFSQLENIVPAYAPSNLSFTLETSENFSNLNLLQSLYLRFTMVGIACVDVLESLPFLQKPNATLFRKLLVNNLGLTLHLKLKDLSEAMTKMGESHSLDEFPILLNWQRLKTKLQTLVNSGSHSAVIWTNLLVGSKALTNVNKIIARAADRKLIINAQGLDVWNVFHTLPPQEPQVQPDLAFADEFQHQELQLDEDELASQIGKLNVESTQTEDLWSEHK